MAQMTEEDHYEIKVYPKGRRIVLRFVGDCWDVHNYELTYNTHVRPVVRRYCDEWQGWDDGLNFAHGYYVWTWEQSVLDIKGDG